MGLNKDKYDIKLDGLENYIFQNSNLSDVVMGPAKNLQRITQEMYDLNRIRPKSKQMIVYLEQKKTGEYFFKIYQRMDIRQDK